MRAAIALALLVPVLLLAPSEAGAHSGLAASDPPIGASLGASPASVRLTFTERPEPSLSAVSVLDDEGQAVESGKAEPASGNPLALEIPVKRLDRGVYTVQYDVISEVDGHATVGTYSFGVMASPGTSTAATSATTESDPSALELVARWILLLGLVVLLGAAVAGMARFGGTGGTDLLLAAAGWSISVIGLALFAEAQRRAASSSVGEILDTAVGEALVWRGVGLGAAGVALLLAAWTPRIRRPALTVAALAAVATIAVHVEAGHAAAGTWSELLTVASQVAHFAAVGIWFGGLAALLLGIRSEPSADKAVAVRRFAFVAAGALFVVVATGTLRAIDELTSPADLLETGYGRAVLAKIALIALIAALAIRNRRRNVPAAGSELDPLRRTSRIELVLAAGAIAAAAVLGTLVPPVSGQTAAAAGTPPAALSTTGIDDASGVEVQLEVASAEPGPNTFNARIEDASGGPVAADAVTLEFDPLEDPGVPVTSLKLEPAGVGEFTATGGNLRFDGRWGVTAVIEGDDGRVEVPLELEVPTVDDGLTVDRPIGEPPEYTILAQGSFGSIRLIPASDRPGPTRLHITAFTLFGDVAPVNRMVVTGQAGDEGSFRRLEVRKLRLGRFAAGAILEPGTNVFSVVANPATRARVRSVFELEIPPG